MMFVQCEVHSKLQQKHKFEHLPVQKTSRRKHSEKEHFDAFEL